MAKYQGNVWTAPSSKFRNHASYEQHLEIPELITDNKV